MRRLLAAALVVLPPAAAFVACSFPDVTFEGAEGGKSDTGALGDGGNGGSDTGTDGPNPDTCIKPPCDCDDDGDPAVSCGGNDCNDHDSRISSKVTEFSTNVPPAGPEGGAGFNGDWNCDGKVEMEKDAGVNCDSFKPDACAGRQGFFEAPGCGQTGTYVYCKPNETNPAIATKCLEDNTKRRDVTRGCR